MTEDEATTKWCPFARVVEITRGEGLGQASNRWENDGGDGSSGIAPGSNCIGSACMAWRWKQTSGGTQTKRGFCGLGGKE